MSSRDPRRLYTQAQRALIAAAQQHMCGVCQEPLPESFHVHHVIPWAAGGQTEESNGLAVCPDCHHRAPVAEIADFAFRDWQHSAAPIALRSLRAKEFSSIGAAPGAGKTLFAGWIFRMLRDTNDVVRVFVFVPNAHLREQWRGELAKFGIHVETENITERPGLEGVVSTYAMLSNPKAVDIILQDADDKPTLFILDEVHHLRIGQGGTAGSWAVNIARIVGTVDAPRHRTLNLTGTPFRSKADERILTMRYEKVGDKIETALDYFITAGQLIEEGQLRNIKVLAYDVDLDVSRVDLAGSAHEGADLIRAIDLDETGSLGSRILEEMIRGERFISGIVRETISRLGHASAALRGAPVKGLMIAKSIDHANQIYDVLTQQLGHRSAFIAHGDMNSAEREIERFRLARHQAVMVAVGMVTEGFDVPDICVLTYLQTWKASLFINQMAGRVMRVSARERELGTRLPATVIIPNEAAIKAAWADVLVGNMNVHELPEEPCKRCDRDLCICPPRPVGDKECWQCGMPFSICACTCTKCGVSKFRGCMCETVAGNRRQYDPLDLEVVSDPELAAVTVDGDPIDVHVLTLLSTGLRKAGLQDVFHEQATKGVQSVFKEDPTALMTYLQRIEE